MKQQEIEQIKQFLNSHLSMSLATYGDHPWIATVYYSFDDNLNLYFLSKKNTLHCEQISEIPQVAIAIADNTIKPHEYKVGLQLWGNVEKVSAKYKITHLSRFIMSKGVGLPNSMYVAKLMKNRVFAGQMYLIKPKKIKYLNEKLYKHLENRELIVEF